MKAYGTVKARPAKIAKGSNFEAGLPALLAAEEARQHHDHDQRNDGADHGMDDRHVAGDHLQEDVPARAPGGEVAPIVALSRPLLTPMMIGVPTAPKDTGVLCTSMPSSTAASAGSRSPPAAARRSPPACRSPRRPR